MKLKHLLEAEALFLLVHRRVIRSLLCSVLSLFACNVFGANAQADDDFFDMSLDDLLTMEVTTVSKKTQRLSQAAAAVYVITHEDLRRSGVTNIPDALRMVPGAHVARIDSNKWAISARGFSGRFSNKLLVLMDGRSVYDPTFSGVYWDVQDTVLEDIDRIEVIRGPGATLWGTNAVNGVINIITKSSADTQGGLVSVLAGNQERGTLALRYGGTLGEAGHYRIYGKGVYREPNSVQGRDGEAEDSAGIRRAGFRSDFSLDGGADVTLQGDVYDGYSNSTQAGGFFIQGADPSTQDRQQVEGGNLLLRYRRSLGQGLQLNAQAYYDYSDRSWAVTDESRDSFDLDLQLQDQRIENHDILYGLRYFYTKDEIPGSTSVGITPTRAENKLFSAFVQDDFTLMPERWVLTVGSKFEHNDFSEFVVQPNVRLLWTPDERQSLWASVARSVRSPTRGEQSVSLSGTVEPSRSPLGLPLPLFATVAGDENFGDERVMSYELGYRWRQGPSLSLDLALFFNRYDSLRSLSELQFACVPSGQFPACLANNPSAVSAFGTFDNEMEAESRGLELVVDWRPLPHWRLVGAYSYLHLDAYGSDSTTESFEDGSARHLLSLRSQWDIRSDLQLDFWVRHSSALTNPEISAYTALDARLGWRPTKNLDLDLVAQNLFDPRKMEFTSELGDIVPIEIDRSIFLRAQLRF